MGDRVGQGRRGRDSDAVLESPEAHRSLPDMARKNAEMHVTSKCYYALRALYALAEHEGLGLMKIPEIAEQERIPLRFLETILNQLKGGGFVQSVRGPEGGYRIGRPASEITVGDVMRFVDGPIAPVDCVSQSRPKECEFQGHCHFFGFWGRVRQAVSDVVDQTTIADLIHENRDIPREYVPDWTI